VSALHKDYHDPRFRRMLERALASKSGDACWCDSGVLFDTCHRDREQQPPVTIEMTIKRLEKTMGRHRRRCLHFDAPAGCSPGIVESHTIQRAVLSRIADDMGHVYGLVPSVAKYLKGQSLIRPIGVNVASVMTCFCGTHDNDLFRPIETRPFEADPEQVFIACYRALCREVFANEWKEECQIPLMRQGDRGYDLRDQVAHQIAVTYDQLGARFSSDVLGTFKGVYDAQLQTARTAGVRFVALEFADTPPLASSSARVPAGDFEGRSRSRTVLEDATPVSFTLLPSPQGGMAVFGWIGDSAESEAFAATIDGIDDMHIADAVLRFALSYAENTFMQPRWWKSLRPSLIDALMERMLVNASQGSLADDGLRVVSWRVRRRFAGKT
jgi:hypothetical protein